MTVRTRFRPKPVVVERPVSRVARLLALAHHVERLVEAGELESYAEAASQLGLTRARLSQILRLAELAPAVQEAILLREVELTDRALRPLVAEVEWRAQDSVEGGRA